MFGLIILGNGLNPRSEIEITGSVAAFSIYGAFKGSKMCLVPFIFMQVGVSSSPDRRAFQVVLIVYSIVLAVICLAGAFSKQQEVDFLSGEGLFPTEESKGGEDLPPCPVHSVLLPALLILSFLLLVSVAPLFLSTHIVYRNFLFISELDDALELIASRRQSNPSKSGF